MPKATKPPAFQFYTKDYLSSSRTRRMNAAARGIYCEGIFWCYEDGSIPADPDEFASQASLEPEEVRAVWEVVCPCFEVTLEDGSITQERIVEQRKKQKTFRRHMKKISPLGIEARHGRRPAKRKPHKGIDSVPIGIPDGTEKGSQSVYRAVPSASALASASKSKIKNDSNTDSTKEGEGPAVETVDNPKRDVARAKPRAQGAANGKPPWLPDGCDPHDDRLAIIEREIVNLRPGNPSWIRELVGRARDKRHAMDTLATLARDFQHASLEETSEDTRILTVQKRMKEIVR